MIYLITGASHTGKTLLAQKLLEKFHFPYLSIDHLKMGLFRSGKCNLTPYDMMSSRLIFGVSYVKSLKQPSKTIRI